MISGGEKIAIKPAELDSYRKTVAAEDPRSDTEPARTQEAGTFSASHDAPSLVSYPPRKFAGSVFRRDAPLPNGHDTGEANRMQLAASSGDKKYFDAFKDDPDLEVRFALLKNPNFRDQPWFQEYKELYENYKRLRTIALGLYATNKLDSLKTDSDLKAVVAKFDKILPVLAKIETNPRIRYTVALNQSLTGDQRALFANDPFAPIHRKLGTKPKAMELFDLIKKARTEWTASKEWDEMWEKGFKAWRGEGSGAEYAEAVADMHACRFFDEDVSSAVIEGEFLPMIPITGEIAGKLISLKKGDVIGTLLASKEYVFSSDQIRAMYAFAPDKSMAAIMRKPNLPADLAASYAKKFEGRPKNLLALATSPYVDAYYERLAALAGTDKDALRKAAVENPLSGQDVLIKVAAAWKNPNTDDKAKLFRHKNTPFFIRRLYATDAEIFKSIASGEKDLDKLIEDVYLSNDFTTGEKEQHLAMIRDVMAQYYDEKYPDPKYFNFFDSKFAPRDALRRAIIGKPRELYYAVVACQRRKDLTREELLAFFKSIADQSCGFLYAGNEALFDHPNIDSGVIIEAAEYAAKAKKNDPGAAAGLQQDFITGYLQQHPAGKRLKDYIYKRLEETKGTDQFSYYMGIVFALSGRSLDIFEPGRPFSEELREKLIFYVGLANFVLRINDGNKKRSWDKTYDIALDLWKEIKARGRAGEFLKAVPYDTDNYLRSVVADTPGLDPEFYKKAYEKEMSDRKFYGTDNNGDHIAFLEALWKNPSVGADVLLKSADSVETSGQAIMLAGNLKEKGLPDGAALEKAKVLASSIDEALQVSKILKDRGRPDPALSLAEKIHEASKKWDGKSPPAEFEALYKEDPETFLRVLDRFFSSYDTSKFDFLPASYVKSNFYSFDPKKVRSSAGREDLFGEIYLSGYGDPFVEELLTGKSVFTRAFMLTMLPNLSLDEARRGDLTNLAGALEKIELFDNSFLEYYLTSQMLLVRDAFANGYVPEDRKYELLSRMVAFAKEDIENYGKVEDKIFFKNGRTRLVRELLKHSIFAARVKEPLSGMDMDKWEMVLHLGVRGVARFDKLEAIRKKVAIGGLYGAGASKQQEFPEHLQDGFHKAIYAVSERIGQYMASPNPKFIDGAGLEKENAFYAAGSMSADFSLVGGVVPYGNNIEGAFYSELGHHFADHVFSPDQIIGKYFSMKPKMNYMSIFEFDDRMAGAIVPPSLEDASALQNATRKYQQLDRAYINLSEDIVSMDKDARKNLLEKAKQARPEQFSSRKNYYLFANAARALEHAANGQAPDTFEMIILGEGMHAAQADGALEIPFKDSLQNVKKFAGSVAELPFIERQAFSGGNFLSTYRNAYPMDAVPLQPVVPEKMDGKGRPDFSYLNLDEQHLTAEWLVYYAKRHARSLLAEGRLEPGDYFPFVKNIPFATKMLFEREVPFDMTDAAARIKELDPASLGQMIVRSGRPLAMDLDKDNRRFHILEKKFKANPDWTLEKLEAEIEKARRL